MALDPSSRSRFNLERASVLLLDGTTLGMSILVQIVTGLGAKTIHRCTTQAQAQELARTHAIDLAIVDAMPPEGAGYDFVRWLRINAPEINRYIPVLMTAGHTPVAQVHLARDCGGHFVIRRPLSPIALLERIIWVAKEGRAFVLDDSYVGPDRRFRTEAGEGHNRRREDRITASKAEEDAAPEAGEDGQAPPASEALP